MNLGTYSRCFRHGCCLRPTDGAKCYGSKIEGGASCFMTALVSRNSNGSLRDAYVSSAGVKNQVKNVVLVWRGRALYIVVSMLETDWK